MTTFHTLKALVLATVAIVLGQTAEAAEQFISFDRGDLLLNPQQRVTIATDEADFKAVDIAAHSLMADFKQVTGREATLSHSGDAQIIIGTLGHSALIDRLVKRRLLDASQLKGKREKFVITIVGEQLVIAGSDRRGTVYGIYELSEQMGVSPWYYWADVPVESHKEIYANKGTFTDGEPAVAYRGIFLNDEAPCLSSWIKNTYGTDYADHRFYQQVFELVLRLRGNMMWPAMWMWSFHADDPDNEKTADDMGIVMGTSHHEPMARNHQEYARNRGKWGAWNYTTNKDRLQQFFREGIERIKGTEQIVTIGMRGDGDEAMSEEADTRLMQQIIGDQRKIIADVTGKKASETPQVWALYKEVLDYYDKGMEVPDDVILLLCDDNWGNVRRVPNAQERKHKGGWGLYYHVDYVGAPRNSKWLNVTPVQNMWEQLTLAYDNGIQSMWILNVGDLKPMEYPISLFMDMAWSPRQYDASHITCHTLDFCRQQFGKTQAAEAARLLNLVSKYNGRCTAEMMDATTYSINTGEWKQVVDEYTTLERDALRQYLTLDESQRDAYRQIILFPIQAMGNIHQMYYAQAMNHKLFSEGNPDCNQWADLVEQTFRRDSTLCADYNLKMTGGKWNGMMTQKHIGYTSWNDNFPADRIPDVKRIENPTEGGYIFTQANGVIAMETEHYYTANNATEAKWTVIADMGRTRSAMTLMPYTKPVEGASITYRFRTPGGVKNPLKIHVVVKSTLDYLNKGGMTYSVSLDGSKAETVNFNHNLNEKPENIYSVYYPTVARRVVESTVTLNPTDREDHTLTVSPHDPAIVFEKIVVDAGGYQPSYLFMNESPCKVDVKGK